MSDISSKTTKLSIWLYGNPVFSLSYSHSSGKVYKKILGEPTDISAYRPDPRDYLSTSTLYNGIGKFERETSQDGSDIWILREVKIEDKKFVYIR